MLLPAGVQVCPIEIPGRGRLSSQDPMPDIATLADSLAMGLPLQVCSHPHTSQAMLPRLPVPLMHPASSLGAPFARNSFCPTSCLTLHCLPHDCTHQRRLPAAAPSCKHQLPASCQS